jgi:hypothetical protein
VAGRQGDGEHAQDLLRESLRVYQNLGDTLGIADSLDGLAKRCRLKGDPWTPRALEVRQKRRGRLRVPQGETRTEPSTTGCWRLSRWTTLRFGEFASRGLGH